MVFLLLLFLLYNSAAKSQVIEDFVFVRRVNFEKKSWLICLGPIPVRTSKIEKQNTKDAGEFFFS